MIGANLARVALLGALLVALALHVPVLAFLGLSLLLGAVGAFFVPARAAFMRRLLDGEALQEAVALEGTVGFLMRLVSPPVMGLLVATCSPQAGVGVDMAGYLLAVALLAPRWVSGPRLARPEAEPAGAWQEGWRVIGRDATLRELLALDTLVSLVGMAAFSITVAFLAQELRLGAAYNGYLLATTGLAGALGTRLASRVGRWPGAYPALAGAIAVTYLLVPFAGSLGALLAVWSLRGLAIGALGVLINQKLAAGVPAPVMGRVQAAWGLAPCLAAFGGSALTPWLLRAFGAAQAYSAFGVALGLLALGLGLTASWRALRGAPGAAEPAGEPA
jgi:hypothetical protein